MVAQARRDWFGELDEMQRQMERFLEHFSTAKRQPVVFSQGVWQPHMDVYQCGDEVVVLAELAGVREEDVRIVLHRNTLIVAGERRDTRGAQARSYQIMEVSYGRFERAIELATPVDPDSAMASLDNGFLSIRLKRAPEPTMKRVQIHTGEETGERQV